MRVLRLDLAGGPVEFHPFVTVVRGLAPTRREELLRVLSELPSGRPRVPGLVEAHGVLLDLLPETLDLLDVRGNHDIVVRAADLPGTVDGERKVATARRELAEAEAALAAADAAVERAEHAVEGAREALVAARSGGEGVEEGEGLGTSRHELERQRLSLAVAQRAHAEAAEAERRAAEAVLEAEAEAVAAHEQREAASRAVSVAAAALEAATDQRDPMAAAALDAALAQLAEAERSVAETDGGAGGAGPDPSPRGPSEEEIAALRAERLELEASVLALETSDPFPVRLALEQLEAGVGEELVADPRAQVLADLLAEVEAALPHLAAADRPDDDLLGGDAQAAARQRLAEAEAEVAAAEQALRGPELDPADLTALDEAHARVLEARDALDRRFRRGSPQKVSEAETEEQEILDRLGYATWSDYLMGHRRDRGEPGAAARLERARESREEAERALRELEGAVAVELRRAELLDRRRELRDEAVDLLGSDPGDDGLVDALRHRRIRAAETGEHLTRLRAALETTGLVLGDEVLPERTMVDLARVFLDEHERAEVERRALDARVAELDARLAEAVAARREVARAGGDAEPVAAVAPVASAVAATEEAHAAVEAARARLARHAQAEQLIEDRRGTFEAATHAERAAVIVAGDAEAALDAARDAERSAAVAVLEAAQELEAAAAAEAEAAAQLATLEERLAARGGERVEQVQATLQEADAALAAAVAEQHQRARAVEAARAGLAEAEAADAVDGAGVDDDPVADADDAEWFLLARLASQRSVSFAGSVPLVLDDALAGFDQDSARRVLGRLERMAATVQLVVVTEDLVTAAWAEALGPERAAIVEG